MRGYVFAAVSGVCVLVSPFYETNCIASLGLSFGLVIICWVKIFYGYFSCLILKSPPGAYVSTKKLKTRCGSKKTNFCRWWFPIEEGLRRNAIQCIEKLKKKRRKKHPGADADAALLAIVCVVVPSALVSRTRCCISRFLVVVGLASRNRESFQLEASLPRHPVRCRPTLNRRRHWVQLLLGLRRVALFLDVRRLMVPASDVPRGAGVYTTELPIPWDKNALSGFHYQDLALCESLFF